MKITVEPRENYTVLHLRGEFDTFYCSHLQKEIDDMLTAGAPNIVLNLRMVKFINSTALGAIIKASKAAANAKGKLLISRPSAFCRDIIEKVGLDRIVPVHDSDEAAGGAFVVADEPSAEASDDSDVLDDETTILFAPKDAARIEHFIPEDRRSSRANPVHGHSFGSIWRGVGRMSGLHASGLRFTWSGGNTGLNPFEMGQMLSLGTKLQIKFRLPLLQRGHCEATVTINEVEERADGVKIGADFHEIDEETQTAVEQYAQDLAFLKKELRQATGE